MSELKDSFPQEGNQVHDEASSFRSLLYYSTTSKTGLRWKQSRGRVRKGSVAGSVWVSCKDGHKYYRVRVNGRLIFAHRIVYFLNYGAIPDGKQIDHIDGNGLNNKKDNLRLTTNRSNSKNRGKNSNNKTGITGVSQGYDSNGYERFEAHWVELDGKARKKAFPVLKHGKEKAFNLAIQYRKMKMAELNSQGAGYTVRHGL